jgi:hypothetical protein
VHVEGGCEAPYDTRDVRKAHVGGGCDAPYDT